MLAFNRWIDVFATDHGNHSLSLLPFTLLPKRIARIQVRAPKQITAQPHDDAKVAGLDPRLGRQNAPHRTLTRGP
jgi:hypothetical protein